MRARFLAEHYFDVPFTRDTILFFERQIYGLHYIEVAAHTKSLNTLRHVFGLSPIPIERYPEADIALLIQQEQTLRARPFAEALSGYRLDYLVWDSVLHPEWNVRQVKGLQKVYESNGIIIYKFPPAATN